MDDARRLILSEHPEQLDPPVCFERSPRVDGGRGAGSLNQAVPLISITTCAHQAPAVISQSQPRVHARARVPVEVGRDFPTHHTTLEEPPSCPFQGTRPKGRSSQWCGPLIAQVYLPLTNRRQLVPWKGSSLALGDVQVRASQGRRGRDTGSYVDRGERREVRAWAARSVKRFPFQGTSSGSWSERPRLPIRRS
jgi:hypothetical protein